MVIQDGIQKAIRRALPPSTPNGLGANKTILAISRSTVALVRACLSRAEAAVALGRCAR